MFATPPPAANTAGILGEEPARGEGKRFPGRQTKTKTVGIKFFFFLLPPSLPFFGSYHTYIHTYITT
jgi:hypothetical protein